MGRPKDLIKAEAWLQKISASAKKRWESAEQREEQRKHRLGKSAFEIYGEEEAKVKYENHSRCMSGRPSKLEGKTLEEIHGKEKAKNIKQRISEVNKGKLPVQTGQTYDEYYGVVRSAEMREVQSKKHRGRKYKRTNPSNSLKGKTIEEILGPEQAEITRMAMSAAKKDKPLKEEHRIKVRETLRKRFADYVSKVECPEPRESKECHEWKVSCRRRDNKACVKCTKRRCMLHVHHIKPWKLFPEFRYVLSNGITLCFPCHKEIHKQIRLADYFFKQLLRFKKIKFNSKEKLHEIWNSLSS